MEKQAQTETILRANPATEPPPPAAALEPTPRTRVKRLPKRAAYDRDTIYSILDTALVCHVGFAAAGQPFVSPTLHVRLGDRL